MSPADTIEILGRVLVILRRAFPQYLRFSRPYIPPGRERLMETIEQIASGQDALIERLCEQIFESGGLPDSGKFPIEFTDTHDLEIDFLIEEAIGYTKQDIVDIEACVEALRLAHAAQSLAAEAHGMTKGHLELLEELPLNPTASTVIGRGQPARDND